MRQTVLGKVGLAGAMTGSWVPYCFDSSEVHGHLFEACVHRTESLFFQFSVLRLSVFLRRL